MNPVFGRFTQLHVVDDRIKGVAIDLDSSIADVLVEFHSGSAKVFRQVNLRLSEQFLFLGKRTPSDICRAIFDDAQDVENFPIDQWQSLIDDHGLHTHCVSHEGQGRYSTRAWRTCALQHPTPATP